jgi:hypothetical protein
MTNISKLGQEFGQYLIQLIAELMLRTGEQPRSLSDMERNIRLMLLKAGQFLLSSWLALQESSTPTETVKCPHCAGQAGYQFKRDGTLITLLGQVEYRRAYYLCDECQQGHYPLDQKLGLRPGQMSAELESLSGMTGVQLPFGQSSRLFERLTLVSLSDQSVAKATQAMGTEVAAQEAEWLAQSQDEGWLQEQQRVAARPKRLYGALDAAKVHIRGEGAEENPWRDLKIGAWFTTTTQPPQQPDDDWKIEVADISYYCDMMASKEFSKLVWATGCQQRAQLADELIFLGDGAEWIWNEVQENYPKAIQIVDWFHATEYIAPVAKAAFNNEHKQQSWTTQVRTDLWEGDLDAVIAAFNRFTDRSKAADVAHKAVTYFTNNRHRMDYPTYRANGYQIGSGTIESGCKQIVTQRLKVAGAIWEQSNAVKTAKARAAFLSDQWDVITSRREHLGLPLAA